jgi:hypothetical protein
MQRKATNAGYGAEMTTGVGSHEFGATPDSNFPVGYDPEAVVGRFRTAIRRAGGNLAVARLSGVPRGTINNLLAGTDVRLSAASALAAACRVSLDWLVTGIGEEQPDWYHSQISSRTGILRAANPEYPEMASHKPPVTTIHDAVNDTATGGHPAAPIDTEALAQAIEIVKTLDGVEGFMAADASKRIAAAYKIVAGTKP